MGRVRSFDKYITGKDGRTFLCPGRIMKSYCEKDRYPSLCLYKNKKAKRLYIHRIVAQAFIPNHKNKPEVNHINGIKTDNNVSNLEWCTSCENKKHAHRTGLATNPRFPGEYNPRSKLTAEQVREIRSRNNERSDVLSKEYGVSPGSIFRIWSGKTWANK